MTTTAIRAVTLSKNLKVYYLKEVENMKAHFIVMGIFSVLASVFGCISYFYSRHAYVATCFVGICVALTLMKSKIEKIALYKLKLKEVESNIMLKQKMQKEVENTKRPITPILGLRLPANDSPSF